MRKLIYPAVAMIALIAAGIAVAHGIGAQDVQRVSATFSATQVKVSSHTCTTSDNKTIVVTDGKYTGQATGDPDLTGAITIRARSVVDTTDHVGAVNGAFRIDVANGRDTFAAFASALDNTSLAGFAGGQAHDPGARLAGNLSATFDPATGFQSGMIGGGTKGGIAVELVRGACKSDENSHEHSKARGTVSAVASDQSSITVAGLTCAVPDELKDKVSHFQVNDRAEIDCTLVNGTNTLTHIQGKH